MNSKALLLAAVAGLGLAACGDFERGKPIPPKAAATGDESPDDTTTPTGGKPVTDTTGGGGGGDVTTLSFAADVHPIFIDKCSTCHGANSSTGFKLTGEADADLDMVKSLADLSNPAESTILKKPTGQVSHGGGALIQVESAEYETILQWLTEGAQP